MLQLITANDTATTEAAYLEVIAAKTGALFRAACQIGAVVADRPAAEEAALAAYGDNLGIAFQLIDDALDYSARQASLGKSVGDDFREGKITLPVLLAFGRGNEAERAFWRRVLEDLEQQEGDLEHAQELIARHGAIETTVARAEAYAQRATQNLAAVPLFARQAGHARPARFLHGPRLLSATAGLRRRCRDTIAAAPRSECSSAW